MLKIIVQRSKSSYHYKYKPAQESGFDNNCKNNARDWLVLMYNDKELFRCRCQSVHNYDWGRNKSNGKLAYGDTIAPGKFQVRLFADPRKYHGEVHEIINAVDMDGHKINSMAMQIVRGEYYGRWLIHDRYSNVSGHDMAYAWSAGCIILRSTDLVFFNNALISAGCAKGDIIAGEIFESEVEDEL